MKIPRRFRALLNDHPLYPSVVKSLTDFKPLLSNERPTFFPEYTNHGISHIESVFQTAEDLIHEQAWRAFTPSDAATILLSILLHDSAMHLTPDSFVSLLRDFYLEYRVEDLDSKNWVQLWDDFLAESSRFDGRKLQALFGNTDPVHTPPLDPDNLTIRDMKLIGEFLRRHHHCLAHQIALFGIPSPTSARIVLHDIPDDIANLAGLIARAHGMPIRACINYLQDRYGNKCEHKDVHAVFLMTLLRVSDYFQIEAERAPEQILKVTTISSPVSKGHYDLHHAIGDV